MKPKQQTLLEFLATWLPEVEDKRVERRCFQRMLEVMTLMDRYEANFVDLRLAVTPFPLAPRTGGAVKIDAGLLLVPDARGADPHGKLAVWCSDTEHPGLYKCDAPHGSLHSIIKMYPPPRHDELALKMVFQSLNISAK